MHIRDAPCLTMIQHLLTQDASRSPTKITIGRVAWAVVFLLSLPLPQLMSILLETKPTNDASPCLWDCDPQRPLLWLLRSPLQHRGSLRHHRRSPLRLPHSLLRPPHSFRRHRTPHLTWYLHLYYRVPFMRRQSPLRQRTMTIFQGSASHRTISHRVRSLQSRTRGKKHSFDVRRWQAWVPGRSLLS